MLLSQALTRASPRKYLSREVKRADRESEEQSSWQQSPSGKGVGLLLARLGHLVRALDNYGGE